MSSTEDLPPPSDTAVPVGVVNLDVGRSALLIVLPIVLTAILIFLTFIRCRSMYRRRMRIIEGVAARGSEPQVGEVVIRPILHTVYLDGGTGESKGWKDLRPISATITFPKPPDPRANPIRPLQDTALLALPLKEMVASVKSVLRRPSPQLVVKSEDDPEKKLVAGVILKMPSVMCPSYRVRVDEVEDSKWEDDQLPELMLACKEVPWLSLAQAPGLTTL